MITAELLKLDPEIVRSNAEAYQGFAFAFREKVHIESAAWLQSNYLAIAGSYWSVVDIPRGRECFVLSHNAAVEHLSDTSQSRHEDFINQTSWVLRAASMAVCGRVQSDSTVNFMFQLTERSKSLSPTALMMALTTCAAMRFSGRFEEAQRAWHQLFEVASTFEKHPVGHLQLPLSFYLDLVRYTFQTDDLGVGATGQNGWAVSKIREWGFRFGERLSERVAPAQADSYHWKRLYSKLLPLEPEALAATMVWAQLLNYSQRQDMNFTHNLPAPMLAYVTAVHDVWEGEPPLDTQPH